jgi:hypothetical protein
MMKMVCMAGTPFLRFRSGDGASPAQQESRDVIAEADHDLVVVILVTAAAAVVAARRCIAPHGLDALFAVRPGGLTLWPDGFSLRTNLALDPHFPFGPCLSLRPCFAFRTGRAAFATRRTGVARTGLGILAILAGTAAAAVG